MPVYTVHGRVDMSDDRAADRFTFVRDGFHFWAFLLAPFWLLWHRLWLAFFGWLVLAVGVSAGIAALGAGAGEEHAADWAVAHFVDDVDCRDHHHRSLSPAHRGFSG